MQYVQYIVMTLMQFKITSIARKIMMTFMIKLHQDQFEGPQDLHPDSNENYDLSGDLGIPSSASNTEQLILNEIQDDDYRKMVQKLNKKQKSFLSCSTPY